MPQIWLTYQEMADAFGTTPALAREGAIGAGLWRVKGHDGVAHVLLTPALAQQYLTGLLAQVGGERPHPAHMVVSLQAVLQVSRTMSSRRLIGKADRQALGQLEAQGFVNQIFLAMLYRFR